jgi:hypothetical protein
MKAVKKPIPVDVYQFLKDSPMWPAGVYQNDASKAYYIDTLEGRMEVQDRSYIVTGPGGEKWAVREDVFEETYEILPDVLPGRMLMDAENG